MGEHITVNEDGTFTVHVHGPVADRMIALLIENSDLREALAKSASREAELEALNSGLMEANDEALKQVKASASREAALVEKLKVAEAVLAATQEVYGACLGPKTHEGINAALAKIKEAS